MNGYSVVCRESGTDCPGEFTTESKEELVKHVELHGREAHQMDLSPADIEPLIKVTSVGVSGLA